MELDLYTFASTTNYPSEAFIFVQRGLDFTAKRLFGDSPAGDASEKECDTCDETTPDRNVTGQQLCCGLRDFAIEQYGLLARSVLKHWHVHKSEDFGRIVFAMVNAGLMRKTDDDSIKDFEDVYDFADAFVCRLQLDEAQGNS